MPELLHILIADDHPLYREGIVFTLEQAPNLRIVGQAGSAENTLALARRTHPHLVLLDITMPGGGLNALAALRQELPETKVVILTASDDEDLVRQCLRMGAHGYILKGTTGGELLRAIESIVQGQRYITPELAARVLTEAIAAPPPHEQLTPREREILILVAQGKSNKEIAAQLFLSEKTVKHHLGNIFRKLRVRNRVEAARYAYEHHLATPPPGNEVPLE